MRTRFGIQFILWELIVLFSWLPAFAYAVGSMLLVHAGIYITIFLITIKFILEIVTSRRIVRENAYIIVLFVAYAIYALIKIQVRTDGGIKELLYLGLIMMSFYMCFYKTSNKRGNHTLYLYPMILSFLMFLLSFNRDLYVIYAEGRYSLYLKYQNPNILSYVLLIMMIYLYLGYIEEKRKIYLLSLALSFYLLYLTHCRSSLIAAIFFLILVFTRKKIRKIRSAFSTVFALIPAFFVIMVIILGDLPINFMGKSGVSGRNSIWKSLFAFGFSRPQLFLLGKTSALTYYERYDSLNNSHNAYMQMLSNYGMIVTVIFIVSLVLLTIKLGKMVNDKYSYAAYIGAVAILINCSFETHIVDAIIGMTFMWILLYRLIIVRESS